MILWICPAMWLQVRVDSIPCLDTRKWKSGTQGTDEGVWKAGRWFRPCAISTWFSLSKFYCHGVSQEKQQFLDDFPLCPPPLLQTQILFILSSSRLWVMQIRFHHHSAQPKQDAEEARAPNIICCLFGMRHEHLFRGIASWPGPLSLTCPWRTPMREMMDRCFVAMQCLHPDLSTRCWAGPHRDMILVLSDLWLGFRWIHEHAAYANLAPGLTRLAHRGPVNSTALFICADVSHMPSNRK